MEVSFSPFGFLILLAKSGRNDGQREVGRRSLEKKAKAAQRRPGEVHAAGVYLCSSR